jgi:SHS2 domain-containing protein
MVDLPAVRPTRKAQVSLRADSLDELMVAWLNELLFRADVSGMFFSKFEVESVNEDSIEASVWGELYLEGRHTVSQSVKAATYHELEVCQTGGGWSATVIFDV